MHISASFDSGNIEVVDAQSPSNIQLRIRPDPPTETPDGVVCFAQWFHFRVAGVRNEPLTLHILDADTSAYPAGWPGYAVACSHDRETWSRVPTHYDGRRLTFQHTPTQDVVWFAYFAPYDLTRHADLLGQATRHPSVRLAPVGTSLDGRSIDRLVIGEHGSGKPVVWIIARQHPGESMAAWWVEGFLQRLLDPHDTLATTLLDEVVLHVIPNMNPDGSFRGHLRTNAAGANLNREWASPTATRSPEVLHTLAAMAATGVDLALDVHGDEGLPYNFIAAAEGVPRWDDRMEKGLATFKAAYERANPNFQSVHGYPRDAPREGNLTMATNQLAERFGCLSMTLEQPFKDDQTHPDPLRGWSPQRAARLGASAIDAIVAVLDQIRATRA